MYHINRKNKRKINIQINRNLLQNQSSNQSLRGPYKGLGSPYKVRLRAKETLALGELFAPGATVILPFMG